MKKTIAILLSVLLLLAALAGCGSKTAEPKTIKVAASPTPHAEILAVAKEILEQARTHSNANKIEHWLGMAPERISKDFVYHRSCKLCNGDRLMLCSDGLSDLLPQTQIEEIMATNASAMDAAKQLIQNALEMSGKDNVTVIVADVSGSHLPMITPAAIEELTLTHELTETVNTTMS